MKFLTIIACIILMTSNGRSQDARVIWQKSIGGIGYDWIDAVVSDNNGDSFVVSTVQEGDNHQVQVSKIDNSGKTVWVNSIGGDRDETGKEIILLNDGSLAIVGATYSKDLYPSQTNNGFSDIFVANISGDGVVNSIRTYGGSKIDQPTSILEKANGNLLVTASTWSNDFDVPNNNGGSDIWVFELNESGDIIWNQTLGSDNDEYAVNAIVHEDGSLIVAGNTESYEEGSYSENHGDIDVVLYKLSSNGFTQWTSLFGGYLADFASGVTLMSNGNYMVAATTTSKNGDVFSNAGGSDAWLFEVAKNGELLWSKTYGSIGNESIAAIKNVGTGFVIFGSSSSPVMNEITGNGSQDFWLCEINDSKEIVDEYLFGASGFEEGHTIAITNEGSIVMGGISNSSDGIAEGNNGEKDGLLLKVDRSTRTQSQAMLHPNPTNNIVYINNLPKDSELYVTDLNGAQVMNNISVFGSAKSLDLGDLPAGVYLITISNPSGSQLIRVAKL